MMNNDCNLVSLSLLNKRILFDHWLVLLCYFHDAHIQSLDARAEVKRIMYMTEAFDLRSVWLCFSTPMYQHGTSPAPTDALTPQRPARGMEADSSTKMTEMEESCSLVQNAETAKENGSRVSSFDFIHNPLKKAFFEGAAVSPPRQHSTMSSLPPKSFGSVTSPRTGTNHENFGSVDYET